jgi:negative regulator of flagellin synthesis FlgM
MRVSQSGNNQVQSTETSGTRQATRTQAGTPAKKTDKPGTAATARDTGGAKSEISARGKEMARAKEVAAAAPDIREEKIAELRRRIAEGKYQTDPEAIAERMINDHVEMAGMN